MIQNILYTKFLLQSTIVKIFLMVEISKFVWYDTSSVMEVLICYGTILLAFQGGSDSGVVARIHRALPSMQRVRAPTLMNAYCPPPYGALFVCCTPRWTLASRAASSPLPPAATYLEYMTTSSPTHIATITTYIITLSFFVWKRLLAQFLQEESFKNGWNILTKNTS